MNSEEIYNIIIKNIPRLNEANRLIQVTTKSGCILCLPVVVKDENEDERLLNLYKQVIVDMKI